MSSSAAAAAMTHGMPDTGPTAAMSVVLTLQCRRKYAVCMRWMNEQAWRWW